MEFFTGLDVGMDETAIWVVDDKGKVALETTVVTDPEAIRGALKPYLGGLRRVGHEAGAQAPSRATAADYLDAAGADDEVAAEIAYWLRYDRLMILPDSSR